MRILVIDDDKDYTEQTCGLLQDTGYETVGVLTTDGAQQLLRNEGNTIDIALVDMVMEGDEEAGLKLIRQMHEDCPDIVPIVVTVYPALENAAACMRLGAFHYAFKDITPKELLLQIVSLAESYSRSADSLRRLPAGVAELHDRCSTMQDEMTALQEVIQRVKNEIDAAAPSGGLRQVGPSDEKGQDQ